MKTEQYQNNKPQHQGQIIKADDSLRQQQIQFVYNKIVNKDKNIFEVVSNVKKNKECQQTSCVLKEQIVNYNRREKSLEELSKRFLSLFLDKEESLLSLDKITEQLGVERRRIYDIINILESLRLVSRKGKNNYKWNGFKKIYQTINEFSGNMMNENDKKNKDNSQKREKSLEMLSSGFLKLFLHWKKVLTLEEAARKLSSAEIDDHKIKTKIRRLYDIANVYKSLGLIEKTFINESKTKKPAFKWIGQRGLHQFESKITYNNIFDNQQQTQNGTNNNYFGFGVSQDMISENSHDFNSLPPLYRTQSEPLSSKNFLEQQILNKNMFGMMNPFGFNTNVNNNNNTSQNDNNQQQQQNNSMQNMVLNQMMFQEMKNQMNQYANQQIQSLENQFMNGMMMKYFMQMFQQYSLQSQQQQQQQQQQSQQQQQLNMFQQYQQYLQQQQTQQQQQQQDSSNKNIMPFLGNNTRIKQDNNEFQLNSNEKTNQKPNLILTHSKSQSFSDIKTAKKEKRNSLDLNSNEKKYITPITKRTLTIIKPCNSISTSPSEDGDSATPKKRSISNEALSHCSNNLNLSMNNSCFSSQNSFSLLQADLQQSNNKQQQNYNNNTNSMSDLKPKNIIDETINKNKNGQNLFKDVTNVSSEQSLDNTTKKQTLKRHSSLELDFKKTSFKKRKTTTLISQQNNNNILNNNLNTKFIDTSNIQYPLQ